MICETCKESIKPDKRYCTQCGTPAYRLCFKCNAKAEAADFFCGDCGTRLTETRPVAKPIIKARPVKLIPHENERRFVTVLFADLVGFTNFSTQKDPEEVSKLVRDMVEIFEPEITSRGGTVDKYEGDAVLARFGAPIAHEDDAEQALMAAIALHRRIGELSLKHQRPDGQPFRLRIGLNTGEVIAGTIDRNGRDYTILGDVVNTSQRFQTAAQPGETVIGELTYRLTRNTFDFESMGTLALKGKPQPALAYKLVGLKTEPGDGRGMTMNADVGPRAGENQFVGRPLEMELLERAYDEVESGSGRLVLISGETGIGKSRLVREFLQRYIAKRGAPRLIIGRAFSFTSEIPHAMLGNLLTHTLGLHPSETLVQPAETHNRLAEVGQRTGLSDGFEDAQELALLGDALGLPDENGLLTRMTITERGLTLQRTVKELLCGLSRLPDSNNQPLIILLEDMHWADRPSAQAVELLAESLQAYPILLIATSRTEWTPPTSWRNLAYYQPIRLGALTTEERASLLHNALEKAGLSLPPETEAAVLERTGGSPFFLEEMVIALKESAEHPENGALQIPATIHEVLLARIDRLDAAARRVLQVGAVLGRRFPERLLRQVAAQALSVEPTMVERGLQNLKVQDFLLENRLAQELEYFFRHGVVQEVAYGIMLTERKQELHELVGVALEELYAGREEEVIGLLAYHYGRSSNREKAHYYLSHAGDRAATFDANQDARRYYEKAALVAATDQKTDLEVRIGHLQN